MRNLKVLLLFDRLRCKGYPLESSIFAGAQRISFQLARHLASQGCTVFFGSDDAANSGPVRRLASNNITHVPVPFRSYGWLGVPIAIVRLLILVRREKIDAIHSHDRWTAMFGRCVSALSGVDYFYTAHIEFFSRKATARLFGRNVTAVSEAVKQNLIGYFGIPRDHIQVIYNGQDVKPPTAEQCRAIQERYELTARDRVISSIGRLTALKGHRFLLAALRELCGNHPEVKCLLVGDGDERGTLEQLARDLHVSKHVVFCGALEDVTPIIGVSEFTVLPSLSEGLPLVALESLLLGVPVVASKVGGIPELVVDGVNGRLVSPGDVQGLATSIQWMLKNREQSARMGLNGRDTLRDKFSGRVMLGEYERYYDARLSARSREASRNETARHA
jgi:glycosyltransferase involved in cell wall biosynthesis